MNQSPHLTCAKVLDTMRLSTYILTETPYSANLSLKKKFIKEYTPSPTPHLAGPWVQDHEAEAESQLVKCTRQLEDKKLYGGKLHNHAITQKQLDVLENDHVQALSEISFLTKEYESLRVLTMDQIKKLEEESSGII